MPPQGTDGSGSALPSHRNGTTDGSGDRITEAYYATRQLILDHQIVGGTPLIQAQLAEEIGHSRATIRAVLNRLAQEGYVVEKVIGTYSRFVVAPLTVEDMDELIALCSALEGIAARRCAQLGDEERTDLADRLEETNRAATERAERDGLTVEEANGWDDSFHEGLVEAAGGNRLAAQIQSLRPQVGRYRSFYLTQVASKNRLVASPEHARIIDAIRDELPEEAQRAMEDHWKAGAERLRRAIEVIGEHLGYASTGNR